MATIKVKFRPSSLPDNAGTIFYSILHNRQSRQLLTAYHIFPDEWDKRRARVISNDKSQRNSLIISIRERIRWDLERLAKVVKELEKNGIDFSVDDVIEKFKCYDREASLFNFMEKIIVKLKHTGKIRTSETYTSTLNSFKKFRSQEDIMLDCLSSEVMENYEAWLKKREVSLNTISFYTRILRAVYNRAVEENLIENRSPFRRVYTGIEKTIKRALPIRVIKKIFTLDLSLKPSLDYARDMFILSFMLRGMSFIDMAFLRKTDLLDGRITYRRRKTGQQLVIAWTKDMQAILNKYPENPTQYLLPILRNPSGNERYSYRNISYNINHNLKSIAQLLAIPIPLTLYVARHSWASAAKAKGIPLSIISEGMGHDSEATTRIYLASLDTTLIDEANSLILSSLQ